MSNLKDLVPSLELCKLIPAGEFAESALMCEATLGMASRQVLDIRIIPHQRITNNPYVDRQLGREYYIYPAPTLQEIMAEIPFAQVSILANGSFVIHPRFGKKRNVRCYDDNAATAALKLWLKLKGVDV